MTRRLNVNFGNAPFTLQSSVGRIWVSGGLPALNATAPSGNLVQGLPFTLTGAGFGLKSLHLAPFLRDTGADASVGSHSTQWNAAVLPNALTGNNNMQNQAPGFSGSGASIGTPHPYVTNILAGCHLDDTNASNEVEVVAGFTQPVGGNYPIYSSIFEKSDSNWAFTNNTPADDNYKKLVFTHGLQSQGSSQPNYVMAFDVTTLTNNTIVSAQVSTDANGISIWESPDANGHSGVFWNGGPSPFNYSNGINGWNYWDHEMLVSINLSTSGLQTGYFNYWGNGAVIVDYVGRTDRTDTWLVNGVTEDGTGPIRSIGFGSYARSRGVNNFRYFCDATIDYGNIGDTAVARVELGTAATWSGASYRAYQVPMAWADGSITFTCWKGALPSGPVYAYVHNVNGTIQSLGPFTLT